MTWDRKPRAGFIAVLMATASGRILYFDANTLTQEGTIPYLASKLGLSSDGSILVAAGDELDSQYNDDWSLRIYSLPSASLLFTWPYSFAAGVAPREFSLSASGTVLGQSLYLTGAAASGTPDYTLKVNPTTGGTTQFANSINSLTPEAVTPRVRVSPDGTLIAASTNLLSSGNPGTHILKNGSLLTALSGFPAGWVDNEHLLINTYALQSGSPVYTGCTSYDLSSNSAGVCKLPEVKEFQPLTSDSIYAVDRAAILSISTGKILWMSADPALSETSAVAGNRVVFRSGTRVLAQGH